MGMKKLKSYPCSSIAKSTGRACRESAWMWFNGHYYCGNHFPWEEWKKAGEPSYRKEEQHGEELTTKDEN